MKYPKSRCILYVALLAGLASAGAPSVFADNKGGGSRGNNSPAPAPATKEHNQTSDDVRANAPTPPSPPAAPSNVRVRVERISPPEAAPGSLPTGRVNAILAGALDARNFVPTLWASPVSMRARMADDAESRLHLAESALASMEKSTSEMSAEGRAQFKSASADAKEKARALRKSVQAVRKAKDQEWDSARARLATDYEAYAGAMARLDALGGTKLPRP